MAKHKWPTAEKAKKILADGTIRGHPLTERQRGLFGILASGKKPTGKRRKRGGRGGTIRSFA